MTRPVTSLPARSPRLAALGLCMSITLGGVAPASAESSFPISAQQRDTAQKVASAGVAASDAQQGLHRLQPAPGAAKTR